MNKITRRAFLISASAVAGGLALSVKLPAVAQGQPGRERELSAWISIAPDETVTIRVAKSEMGQGVATAMPMLVAEELDCDWSKVRIESASAARSLREENVYQRMRTGGSRSVRGSQEFLRQAGAAAKLMLVAAAAREWSVDPGELKGENGIITHPASGRQTTYGRVAAAAANVPAPAPETLVLKTPDQWRLLGTPAARLDIPSKVDGSATFGIDVRLPDMLHAAVAMSPVWGGTLRAFDADAVRGMPGIRHILKVDDAAVAIVADTWWQARRALDVLPIDWNEGPNAGASTASQLAAFRAGLQGPGALVRQEGDPDTAMVSSVKTVEAEYVAPYLSHAQLEPINATALVRDGRVEVWAPTQDPMQALEVAAEAAGVDPALVEVHATAIGGGFGRRLTQDYVAQAVRIAAQVPGRPVKMLWSREDDFRHGFYRPLSLASFRAGLGEDGLPLAWQNRIVNHSIFATLRPGQPLENGFDDSGTEGLDEVGYAIPNRRVDYVPGAGPVRAFFWRSVGHSQNAFFLESFIDELAHAAQVDPYEYRRRLLRDNPRHLAVLEAAAERAGWGGPLAEGRGRGIAIHESYGTVVAEIVEASIEAGGRVRVHKVVAAVDCGFVVNPNTLKAQIEGAVIDGLSAALYGEITIENGRVVQANYDQYELMRLGEAPEIDVHLVPSGQDWGGAGEPGLPPVAPALTGAIFAATGKRIRSLPIRSHDLSG